MLPVVLSAKIEIIAWILSENVPEILPEILLKDVATKIVCVISVGVLPVTS